MSARRHNLRQENQTQLKPDCGVPGSLHSEESVVATATAEAPVSKVSSQSVFIDQIQERANKTTAVMAELLNSTNTYLHWGINE